MYSTFVARGIIEFAFPRLYCTGLVRFAGLLPVGYSTSITEEINSAIVSDPHLDMELALPNPGPDWNCMHANKLFTLLAIY